MKILILGGTGTMGAELLRILGGLDCEVLVTSRREHIPETDNIKYLVGNAHDTDFLKEILKGGCDAVVDFMAYSTEEFAERLKLLLESAGQYLFLSSARVYADSKQPLTEDSERLLDVCKDQEYLDSDEYALAKARQEDLLRKSGRKNWTIIRPYVTYSEIRLQLGIYEKELWLYRILKGHTVLFPQDIGARYTTMTYAGDVARAIARLIANPSALGETVHITQSEPLTWNGVLSIYLDVLEKQAGIVPEIKYVDGTKMISVATGRFAQIHYDRLYDRIFDNKKIVKICGEKESTWIPMREGLESSLKIFLNGKREFRIEDVNWKYEGYSDHICHEYTPLCEIPGAKNKLKYLIFRYMPHLWMILTTLRNEKIL